MIRSENLSGSESASQSKPSTDLEALFELVKATAKRVFEENGQCVPIFVTMEPPMVIPCVFSNAGEKRMQVALVKALFKERGVKRYGLAFEAWFSAMENLGKSIDVDALTPPSENPDRKECIFVTAEEKGMPPLGGVWYIERDRKGRGKIKKFEVPKGEYDSIGAFRNMLGADILN